MPGHLFCVCVCVWETLVQIKTIQYDVKIHTLSKQHSCFNVWVALGFSPNTINYLENLQVLSISI